MINQQPALWPCGVEYEKEFPESSHANTPGEFLFLWRHFSFNQKEPFYAPFCLFSEILKKRR
jgi:hypothetical protein